MSRCQARAVAVLQLYTKLNAFKGHSQKNVKTLEMLKNQNECTPNLSGPSWHWMYSNPTALGIAAALQDYGLQHTKEHFDPTDDDANDHVRELGMAWWPLPPPTPPVLVSLINALKGEHEWDDYLTVQHFCANTSTLDKVGLRPGTGQLNQHRTTAIQNYLYNFERVERNHPNIQLPTYTWYSRPHITSGEFWYMRILLVFNLCNALLTRDERLLGNASPTIVLADDNASAASAGPVDLFAAAFDDDKFELPSEFSDDCLVDIMSYPVQLTQSHGKMDWLALYRVLLSTPEDPFTRGPLTVNDIVPLPHINFSIKLFKLRRGVFQ